MNVGKRPPAVFVLDLAVEGSGYAVQPVTGLPPDCSVGQPVWAPTGARRILNPLLQIQHEAAPAVQQAADIPVAQFVRHSPRACTSA